MSFKPCSNAVAIDSTADGRISPPINAAAFVVGLCATFPALIVPIGAVAAGAAFQAVKQHIAD